MAGFRSLYSKGALSLHENDIFWKLKFSKNCKETSVCSMHCDRMHKDVFLCHTFNNIAKEAYIAEWVFDMERYYK